MESVSKLWSGRVPMVCEGSREYFRDVYDHLVRINGTLDTCATPSARRSRSTCRMVTIEESEDHQAARRLGRHLRRGDRLRRHLGMNFEHMPELKWKYGYPMALAVIALTCFMLYRRFKRVGWL
jgi:magnesium transporter